MSSVIDTLRTLHRARRLEMSKQQGNDRRLESFIRRSYTDWNPDEDEKARAKANAKVAKIIAAAREGEGDELTLAIVRAHDAAQAPSKELLANHEKAMCALARELPVWPWCEAIRGAAEKGLATIVAEAGDLSNYATPAKLWKRLGFAPYQSFAGSAWRRKTWAPRQLTAEEWTDIGFSPVRYSFMQQIASKGLFLAQWQSAAKAQSDDGKGRPTGPYGKIYAARRAHTATTHPDWTPKHSHMDALRIMMKAFLKNLWSEWHRCAALAESPAGGRVKSVCPLPGSPLSNAAVETPSVISRPPPSPADRELKSVRKVPGSPNQKRGRRTSSETRGMAATAQSPADGALKPAKRVPGSHISKRRRRSSAEIRSIAAPASSPAVELMKSNVPLPGSHISKRRRRRASETRRLVAPASSPAGFLVKSAARLPGSPT
jgi:hypothetical protein